MTTTKNEKNQPAKISSQSDYTLSIQEELNRIQQNLKAPKSNVNTFGKYKYRSSEDILEAVKPLLNKCTLIMDDEIVNIGDRYYVKATARLGDGDRAIETSAYARESLDKKGMDDAQITGSASSYARKYALNGLFAIDDEKDADTRDNSKEEKTSDPVKISQEECHHANTSKHQVSKEGQNKGKWFVGCDTCKKFMKWSEAPTGNDLVTNENGSKSYGHAEFGDPK